ncbi:hypothetical protein [Nocardia xishanensis]|uniref:hypothetical protein n=1 Tax=Nocardia xishanensis TaxID=238964 RepID=UPI000AFC6062|nr:hypothetical protein [Nocardia xishanensis]
MSGENISGAEHTWPERWRWEAKRVRDYERRGWSGVWVEGIEHAGVRESGLLLAMRTPRKIYGVLAAALGSVLVASAGTNAVLAVVERTWVGLLALVFVGPVGAVALLAAYGILRARRGVVPGLLLTPTRILYRDNVGSVFAIPWQQVSAIDARIRRQGGSRYDNLIVVEAHPSAEVWQSVKATVRRMTVERGDFRIVTVLDRHLLMNPLIAYSLLRHYLANPDQRPNVCRALPLDQH